MHDDHFGQLEGAYASSQPCRQHAPDLPQPKVPVAWSPELQALYVKVVCGAEEALLVMFLEREGAPRARRHLSPAVAWLPLRLASPWRAAAMRMRSGSTAVNRITRISSLRASVKSLFKIREIIGA